MRAQTAVLIVLLSSFPALCQTQAGSQPEANTQSQTQTEPQTTTQPQAKSQPKPKTPSQTKTQPQTKAAAVSETGNVASREQIMKLLDMLQVPESLAMTLDAMKEQMKVGALQMFSEKVAHPSPAQVQSVNAIVDEEFKKIGMEDLIQDVVPIYQKHLTRSDVEAVIRFYSSPVGQKIRREQPAMARESLEATSAGQRGKMELLLAKLDLRIEQLIQNEERKPPPEKQ